jgi:hypothetical protein
MILMRMKKLQPILNSVQNLISTWNLDASHQKTIEDAVKTYLQAEEEHHLAELSKLFQKEVADATLQTALKNIIRQSFVKAGRDIHIGDTIHQTVLIRVGAAEERVNRYLTYDSKYQLPNTFFLKRLEVLADLRNRLTEHVQVVVTGQPQIGKTVLAQLYIQEYGLEYDFVAWIPISTHLTRALVKEYKRVPDLEVLNGINQEAAHLKWSESERYEQLALHILDYWSHLEGRKLFVFDDVPTAEALFEPDLKWMAIPNSHFLILAETADGLPFSEYKCLSFDTRAFSKGFGEVAGWKEELFQQIEVQNKELSDWTKRLAPNHQPQKLKDYLTTLHQRLEKPVVKKEWVQWLLQQNRFSAESLWVLLQAAVLPSAVSVDLWIRLLGLAHRDRFRNQNVLFARFQLFQSPC